VCSSARTAYAAAVLSRNTVTADAKSQETGFEPERPFDTKVSAKDQDGGALGLAVLGPTGFATYPLQAGASRVIGRDPQADIVVDDASVSRRHAKLHVGDVIELEDLGSSNGTFVRGQRLGKGARTEVGIGESFRVGDQVLLVQRVQAATGTPRRVHRGDYLEARLDEECTRGTRFALIKLRVDPATTGALDGVAAELSPSDILALSGAGEYGVLMLEVGPTEAGDVAERLSARLKANGHTVRVGVACHPRDGRSLATLLDVADRGLLGRDASTTGESQSGVVVSPRLRQIYQQVDRVAAGDIAILVLGETGAGKDVLANHVHQASRRVQGPFVRINCAALAESLIESELFGHEKGAFTGSTGAKLGLLETARGGTVFLDEVGEIPLGIQAKLLQVIEQKQVLRVGGLTPHPIDVRFVAATNRDLEREAERGTFRQDLYFRLAGFTVVMPPLRERRDEILPLALHFLARVQPASAVRFSPEAEELLTSYSWPGNVRELRHVIERAVLLCSGTLVTPDHLPAEKMRSTLIVRQAAAPVAVEPTSDETLPPLPADKQRERDRILEILTEVGGNQSEAARRLGVSRSTLITRIEEFGLRRPRKR
jgi:two-component system response regulator AtoC